MAKSLSKVTFGPLFSHNLNYVSHVNAIVLKIKLLINILLIYQNFTKTLLLLPTQYSYFFYKC